MTAAIESGQSHGTVEVTPSGIPVYYQSKPKRLYRISDWPAGDFGPVELLPDAQAEGESWREVPSVSTVLDILEGPPPWWGMQVGVQGVLTLYEDGLLVGNGSPETSWLAHNGYGRATMETVVDLLKQHKLTTNDSKNKGSKRGQSVHDAFEVWARTGLKPDPSIYPDEERGYVEGLVAFLQSIPSAEPLACEVMVASPKYGYAGRYDLRIRTSRPHDVVFHHTPVRGFQYKTLEPGEYLIDLKTSKDILAKHARQLEGYEQASIESGYEPTDGRGILHVSADGRHKFKRSWATFADFECVLRLWQSDQAMKERK